MLIITHAQVVTSFNTPVTAPFAYPAHAPQTVDVHYFPDDRSVIVLLAGGDIAVMQIDDAMQGTFVSCHECDAADSRSRLSGPSTPVLRPRRGRQMTSSSSSSLVSFRCSDCLTLRRGQSCLHDAVL